MIFLISLLSITCTAKIYYASFQNDGFIYLTKFTFSEGYGLMHARARNLIDQGSLQFELLIYLSSQWQQQDEENFCEKKKSLAKAKKVFELSQSEWSPMVIASLDQRSEASVWYFAIAKCSNNEQLQVEVDLEIYNSDQSRLSYEDRNLSIIYLIHCIGSGILLAGNAMVNRSKKLNNSYLIFSNFLDLLSATLFLWNILQLQDEGEGRRYSSLVSFLAQVFGYVSHFSLQAIFIVNNSDKELHEFHVLMIFFFTVLHIIVVIISKIQRNNPYSMHEFQGASGVLIIIFKLVMGIYYMKTLNPKLIMFFYYLIIPIAIILVNYLNCYQKQQTISLVNFIAQFIGFFGCLIKQKFN